MPTVPRCSRPTRAARFVEAFDIHDDGTLGGRRVLADVGALPGGPAGGRAGRRRLHLVDDVSMAARCCACGPTVASTHRPVAGEPPDVLRVRRRRSRRLLVTTASRGTRAIDEPLAGRLLALDVGVTGRPAHAFTPDEAVR
jgi:hypothetical protein